MTSWVRSVLVAQEKDGYFCCLKMQLPKEVDADPSRISKTGNGIAMLKEQKQTEQIQLALRF